MSPSSTTPAAPAIFYGWILVVVLMLTMSVGIGTSMYMYSVVAGAVGSEFGADRLLLMAGSTGMSVVLGLCSPVVGTLLDRYPSKWVLVTGAVVLGVGFIAIALSTHIWMVVASYILFISVGAATLSPLTAATLLTRWFVRYRGLAIGVALLGTQLGGFVFPPILASTMDTHSWRIAIGGLGVLIILAMPVFITLLVVDRPEDKRLEPLGGHAGTGRGPTGAVAAKVHLPLARLFAERNFLLLILIVGATTSTNLTLLSNLTLFATDLGETAVRGAFMVSLVAFLGIFFSPLIGWLCDVISVRAVTAIVTLSLAAACLTFGVATNYPMLLIAACFQGIGGGGIYPVWASTVGHLYHTNVYGRVMGAITLVTSMIAAASPLLAGWIYDTTGSYRVLFGILLAALLGATACLTLLRVPRHEGEKFGATQATETAHSGSIVRETGGL